MARIFLDANFVIETIGLRKSSTTGRQLAGHEVCLSPLTIHIICYSFKIKVPDERIFDLVDQVLVVNLTSRLINPALIGPTQDFEDNIQLHSAVEANCDYFLTNDKELLILGYFGKTKIVNSLP